MTRNPNSLLCWVFLATAAWTLVADAQDTDADTEVKDADRTVQTELELLRAQLAARQAINEELLRRIEDLERQLAAQTRTSDQLVLALDASFPKPPADSPRGDAVTAIEEALVSKGLVLMPSGSLRSTPSMTWGHSGGGDSRADSYAVGLTLESGLPWGMAAAVSVPYIWRDFASGSNHGMGDPTISLAKALTSESGAMPSLLLRFSYTHDAGEDPFTLPAIASGFQAASVSLAAVKRFDPLVFYGSISYAHGFEKFATISVKDTGAILFQGKIKPGDTYGLNAGVSLAATPAIALDAGLSFSFTNSSRYELLNTAFYPGRTTVGYFSFGTSMLLTNRLSLSIGASAGVTKEASDVVLSLALPYRF